MAMRVAILVSVFAVSCFAPSPVFAQQRLQTLLVDVDHRNGTSLERRMALPGRPIPSPALYTSNGEINDKAYAMNEHPNLVGKHNQEYDFATAPTLKVPGDWNTQVPQLFNYEGVVWYQRDFDAAAPTRVPFSM